jgi:exodeoxyribonuclease V gamma subunit
LQFFQNPCRMLLAKRLNVSSGSRRRGFAGRGAFPARLSWIAKHSPGGYPTDTLLAGVPTMNRSCHLALAGNEFPPGPLRRALDRRRSWHACSAFVAELAAAIGGARRCRSVHAVFDYPLGRRGLAARRRTGRSALARPAPLSLRRSACGRLSGRLDQLTCFFVPRRLRESVRKTTWHSRDGSYRLTPLRAQATAHAQLGELLHLYRRGLSAPLHFFPKSAWAYINRRDNSLTAARKCWRNSRNAAWGEER